MPFRADPTSGPTTQAPVPPVQTDFNNGGSAFDATKGGANTTSSASGSNARPSGGSSSSGSNPSFIFLNPGMGGNRNPDSNERWIDAGYVGFSEESKRKAKTDFRTGTIDPQIIQWVTSNLSALNSAAGKTRGFKSAATAWEWLVDNTPDGQSAFDWVTSLPNWNGGGSPSSGGGGGGGGSRRGGGGGGGGGGGSFSQTSTSVNITDPTSARALINQTLSNALGREASDAEISQFTHALNAAEKANPSKTTASGYSDGAGNTTSSSTTTGGIDRGQVILDQVKGTAEYQAFNTDNVFRQAMDVLASRGLG